MKTQVIMLDPSDDLVSIRDKMQWARAARLLLVLPQKELPPLRRLDLYLLQRHASRLGTRLGLVTKSKQIRRDAAALSLPVFATTDEAQNSVWPDDTACRQPAPHRKIPDLRRMSEEVRIPQAPWRSRPAVRFSFFALAALAILALLATLLPSATITLMLHRIPQEMNLSISASPDQEAVNPAGSVPAYQASVHVEGSKTIVVNSRSTVPDQPAGGMVRFTNLGLSVVGIPAGTVVRTSAEPVVRFETLEDGVLAGEVGKSMELPVRALDPGTGGNLPAGVLTIVEGGLGASLSVTNPDPTSGGSDRTDRVPSVEDRNRLRASLMGELQQQAYDQVNAMIPAGSIIFPDTILPGVDWIETYDPPPGKPGDALSLTINGQMTLVYARGDELESLEQAVLDAGLPEGSQAQPGTFTATVVGQPATDEDGSTHWTVHLERELVSQPDPLQVALLVRGMRMERAGRELATTYELEAPAQIDLRPFFWPWLPPTILRIAIIYH